MASDVPIISNREIKIDCLINDYLSKDKIIQIPITIFHPLESRLKSQTTNIRRGSSLFFSGEITLVDGKLYLELHNFSFLKGQTQTPSKTTSLPWLNATSEFSTSSMPQNNAQLIHQEQGQKTEPIKQKSQKPFQPHKVARLADIASSILDKSNNQDEENDDNGDVNENINEDVNESTNDQVNNETDEMVIKILFLFFIINYIFD